MNSDPKNAKKTNMVQLLSTSEHHGPEAPAQPRAWDCRNNLPKSELEEHTERKVPPYCEHNAAVVKDQAEEALKTVNSVPT